MQRAASRAADAHFLPDSRRSSFTSEKFTYSLSADKNNLQLSASEGSHKAERNVDWAVGAGELAWTFLYQQDGRWYQSEASFYTKLSGLDITTGFGAKAGTSITAALGNILTAEEARSCFGCHTVHATTSAGLDPAHAEAGIGCESCHGPGRQHGDSMAAQQVKHLGAASAGKSDAAYIFQPEKLSPSDSIDFCGSCHRSFADASLSTGPQADRAVVRFQPYRLEESKCWRATQDARLTCVACHDPHKPLNRVSASYDANCLQCHSGEMHAATVCPKATHDCVSCHMPKVELPSMHGSFTDHFIRVAKVGDPLPR